MEKGNGVRKRKEEKEGGKWREEKEGGKWRERMGIERKRKRERH